MGAMLLSKRAWKTQPQTRAEPDFSASFMQGFGDALVGSTASHSVMGSPAIIIGTNTQTTERIGKARTFSSSSVNMQRVKIANSTMGKSLTTGATIMAIMRPNSVTNGHKYFSLGSDNGGPGNTVFYGHSGASPAYAYGTLGGSSSYVTMDAVTSFSMLTVEYVVWFLAIEHFGTSPSCLLMANGDYTTKNISGDAGNSSLYNWLLMNGYRSGATDYGGGNVNIFLVSAWNRMLEISEMLYLTANPWALFKPHRIFVPMAAPTGTSINYWNGSAWVPKPLKRWNSTDWVPTNLKYHNGSGWE